MPGSPSPDARSAASRSPSQTPEPVPEAEACPFLIRVFVTKGKHTPLVDFDEGRFPAAAEFQVHGWKHSTPTSLIQQLYSVFPPTYRSPVARYTFKHVFVDAHERGLYRAKDLVSFSGRDFMATVSPAYEAPNGGMDRDLDEAAAPRGVLVNERTLDAYGFMTGDLLSVAIVIPEPRSGAAPTPTSIRGAFARERAERAPPAERWGRNANVNANANAPARWEKNGNSRAPAGNWREQRGGRRGSPDRRSRSPPPRRESWSTRRERD